MHKSKILRLLLVIIAIGLLCLLGMGGALYFEFIGSPWERAATRKQVEAYLQKRFTQNVVITGEELDFKSSRYGFVYTAHTEGSEYWFHVQQQGRGTPDFWDDYYAIVWKTEAEAKIQAFLQSIYPVETETTLILESADFSQLPQWGISQAPSLMDLRAHVSNYNLTIWVTPDFDKDQPGREYETMYRVIQFLKESDLVPGGLGYSFGYPDSDEEDQNYIWYDFSLEDLQAITSVQTMITILERAEDGDPSREVFP